MGLRTLRTLVAIADHGGFTAAAGALHVTQSAVSMQMKALELEWGMPLFDRSRRPPVLNEAGWRLVEHGRELTARYDALKRGEALHTPSIQGTVRMGIVPTAATDILPDLLAALRRDHAALLVRARSALSPDLLRQVGNGTLDAAIVTAPDTLDPALLARPVRTDELKLVVHRDAMEETAALTLARAPFIRFTRGMGIGRIVDEALRARGIEVEPMVEVDSVEAMLRMVRLRLGAAIIPISPMAADDTDNPVATLSLEPALLRRLSFVTRREHGGSPLLNALYAVLIRVTTLA